MFLKRKRTPMQIALMAVSALAACAVVYCAVDLQRTADDFAAKRQVNQGILDQLRAQIDAYDAEPESDLTADEVREILHSATEAGVKVADYQTQYLGCYRVADSDAALGKNMADLRPYIDDSGTLVSGGTVGYMPWYVPSRTPADSVDLKWTFMTTYEFSGNTLPVLWKYETSAHDLVAFAYGTYDVEKNQFRDIVVHPTALGLSSVYVDDSYTPPSETDNPRTDFITNDPDLAGYDPEDPSTLPDGYVDNGDGTLTSPGGMLLLPGSDGTGSGLGELSDDQYWDGTLPQDGTFAADAQNALAARQEALANGPSQEMIDENLEILARQQR